MKVVTVANQKGGVGKTTTVVTLASALAIKGYRVLAIDADPQGHVALSLGIPQEDCFFDLVVKGLPLSQVTRESGRPGLQLIPGSKMTSAAQSLLVSQGSTVEVLRRLIQPRRGDGEPDFVVIDTPPGVGLLHAAAIYAADLVVIPCACDFLSTDGVTKALETIAHLAGQGWSGNLIGVIPTFYDDQTRESKAVREDLIKTLGPDRVLPPVHRATVLKECVAQARTIWELDPASRTAKEYAVLTASVLKGGNGHG